MYCDYALNSIPYGIFASSVLKVFSHTVCTCFQAYMFCDYALNPIPHGVFASSVLNVFSDTVCTCFQAYFYVTMHLTLFDMGSSQVLCFLTLFAHVFKHMFCDYALNPIPHGVFWITHMGGGQILPVPYNSVILKDMDLKFGMLD